MAERTESSHRQSMREDASKFLRRSSSPSKASYACAIMVHDRVEPSDNISSPYAVCESPYWAANLLWWELVLPQTKSSPPPLLRIAISPSPHSGP